MVTQSKAKDCYAERKSETFSTKSSARVLGPTETVEPKEAIEGKSKSYMSNMGSVKQTRVDIQSGLFIRTGVE